MDERFSLIREWYMNQFPSDELGEEINPELSFFGLFQAMDNYKCAYSTIGVFDSIVRERVFERLALIMGVSYNYIYEQWLRNTGSRKVDEQ